MRDVIVIAKTLLHAADQYHLPTHLGRATSTAHIDLATGEVHGRDVLHAVQAGATGIISQTHSVTAYRHMIVRLDDVPGTKDHDLVVTFSPSEGKEIDLVERLVSQVSRERGRDGLPVHQVGWTLPHSGITADLLEVLNVSVAAGPEVQIKSNVVHESFHLFAHDVTISSLPQIP